LQIGRDFSDWIKNFINSQKFVENQDFEVFAKFGENPSGGRPSKEYLLTMDMAKWISLSVDNVRGDEARRYFIAWEKKMWEHASRHVSHHITQSRSSADVQLRILGSCILSPLRRD
jgi:phage anti-repressor protein